jgi:hypothetical protein
VILCLHPTGHHSVLAAPPGKNEKPALLFPNHPNEYCPGLLTTKNSWFENCALRGNMQELDLQTAV